MNNCEHAYSRTLNQPYPRKCVKCGEIEFLNEEIAALSTEQEIAMLKNIIIRKDREIYDLKQTIEQLKRQIR